MKKRRLVGIIILGILGILIGLLSLLLGVLGGPVSIIFGGLWILFGLKLLNSPQRAKKAILITSIPHFLLCGLGIYAGLTVDRFLFMGVIFQAPIIFLNIISFIYLNLSYVKRHLAELSV